MDSSNKSIQSPSTPPLSPQQNEEPLPVQTPTFIPTPTFPRRHQASAVSHEGTYFQINRDGYIANLEGGRIEENLTFTEKIVIVDIPRGCDVIHALEQFARRNELILTIACAKGQISAVDLSFPNSRNQQGPFFGYFQLVAFSGTYCAVGAAAAAGNAVSCFNVTLATARQGEFIGGLVAGRMTAATVVTVFAFITKE